MNSSPPENHPFFGGASGPPTPLFHGHVPVPWWMISHHQSMSRDLCTHCQESLMGNDHTPYTMFWPWSKYVGAVMFLLELPRKDVCPGWNGTAQKWKRHAGPPVCKSCKLKQPTISAGIGFQHLHAWLGATWNKPCIHILFIIYHFKNKCITSTRHWKTPASHEFSIDFPDRSGLSYGKTIGLSKLCITYGGWKKSCTTLDGRKPVNHGVNPPFSTGAGLLSSTVCGIFKTCSLWSWIFWNWFVTAPRLQHYNLKQIQVISSTVSLGFHPSTDNGPFWSCPCPHEIVQWLVNYGWFNPALLIHIIYMYYANSIFRQSQDGN